MSDNKIGKLDMNSFNTNLATIFGAGEIAPTPETEQHQGNDLIVSFDELEFYPNQKYRMYAPGEEQEMIESLKTYGLLHPIIIRPGKTKKYEVLAGRNRSICCQKAEIPIKAVLHDPCSDEMALGIVNVTNLVTRGELNPIEKAYGYRDLQTSLEQLGQRQTTSEVANATGDDIKKIHRYIRLTHLIPELQEYVIEKRIPVTAGYELSYFQDSSSQQKLALYLDRHPEECLNLQEAKLLREQEAETILTIPIIDELLHPPKKPKHIVPSVRKLSLSASLTEEELQEAYQPLNSMKPKERKSFVKDAIQFYLEHHPQE